MQNSELCDLQKVTKLVEIMGMKVDGCVSIEKKCVVRM
jgi:hypothetical protein